MERKAGSAHRIEAAATSRGRTDLERLVTAPGIPEKEAILRLKVLLPTVFPRGEGESGASREERAFMSAYLDLCLGRAFGDAELERTSRERCLRVVRGGPVAPTTPAAAPEGGGV